MKILILTPAIFPVRHSGISKLVYYMATHLRDRGHDITVLTNRYEESHPLRETADGLRFYRVPVPKRGDLLHGLWPLAAPLASYKGQRDVRKDIGQFDAVWVHNPLWILVGFPKIFWPEAKVLYDFHSGMKLELMQNYGDTKKVRAIGRVYDGVATRVMKKCDAVVVHSRYNQGVCRSLLGPKAKVPVEVIYGGADTGVFRPSVNGEKESFKRSLGLPTDRPVFLTARGLKRRTGVDKLVEAAALLKNERLPFFLDIIGDGPWESMIHRMIRELGLFDSVRLTSNLSEKDLAQRYRTADAFVLPTQGAEGFGLATAEALSSGLPVLGTDNGATSEILGNYSADWIIRGCAPENLFEKMADYCRRPEKYAMAPEKIRDVTVGLFNWAKSARNFEDLLAKIA